MERAQAPALWFNYARRAFSAACHSPGRSHCEVRIDEVRSAELNPAR